MDSVARLTLRARTSHSPRSGRPMTDGLPSLTSDEWAGRARREAAAILAEAMPNTSIEGYERTLLLVSAGWLQGFNLGAHETLAEAENAYQRVREDLTA